MSTSYPYKAPLVLSALDLPDNGYFVAHACEDCACSVSTSELNGGSSVTHRAALTRPETEWAANPNLISMPLDANHSVVFNSLSHRGPRVINRSAGRIVESFSQPRTRECSVYVEPSSPFDIDAAFERLVDGEIILPSDWLPCPPLEDNHVLTAWLHTTNDCNLRCPYCYVSKAEECMNEETGRASINALFRSADEHGYQAVKLKYAGGEATLRWPFIMKMHDYAQKLAALHGLQLEGVILSNGVAFSNRLIDAIKDRGIGVMISLDGLADFNDSQRPMVNGGGSFHLIERTIDRLIEANYPPHISITITEHNVGGLADIVRLALERDLTFSFNLFRDNGCIPDSQDQKLENSALVDGLLAAFAVIEDILLPWSVLGTILDRGQLLQPRLRSCGVGQDYVVIDHRGQIARCHMKMDMASGDVFQDDPLLAIRQHTMGVINPSVDEMKECSTCDWRYWCSGGCPVATHHASGRFDVRSPYCDVYKAIYPAALRLEGLRILKYGAES